MHHHGWRAQQIQSHCDDVPVPLNSKPFYSLPSETCNFSGNSLSASCHALEKIYLQRKQREKKILQFSATPYTGQFFMKRQYCYIKHSPQWEVQGQLMNFLSVLPVYCIVPSGIPVYLHLVIPRSFSLKSYFRWLFEHKPHSQLFFIVCSGKRPCQIQEGKMLFSICSTTTWSMQSKHNQDIMAQNPPKP